MLNRKSAKQAYLLGLGAGILAGAVLSFISLWLTFILGVGLIIASFKLKEIKKEAEDFFEIKED